MEEPWKWETSTAAYPIVFMSPSPTSSSLCLFPTLLCSNELAGLISPWFKVFHRIRLSLLGVLELINFLVSTEKYPCNTLQKRQNFVFDSSMSSFYGQVCLKLVSRRGNVLEFISWIKLVLPPTPAPLPPPNTHTPQHTPRYVTLSFFLIVMSVFVIITEMFSLHTKTQDGFFKISPVWEESMKSSLIGQDYVRSYYRGSTQCSSC